MLLAPVLAQQTTRPVIRGRQYAAASMKPESTQVAERILRAGGNAFDATVACQAVLAQVDAASNGVGSDAVILIYDARAALQTSSMARGIFGFAAASSRLGKRDAYDAG